MASSQALEGAFVLITDYGKPSTSPSTSSYLKTVYSVDCAYRIHNCESFLNVAEYA